LADEALGLLRSPRLLRVVRGVGACAGIVSRCFHFFFCVEVGGLVREFGKWEGGKAIAAAARFEGNKNFQSRRGGIARKEGNTHWADRRSEAGRCGHDVAREARAMRTTSIQHSGKTSTQRRTIATPPRTKDKQPNFHPSPGETHLKGMKEFKCQNRLYRIDQLDNGSLDAPPNINNRGSHVGIASAAKKKWNFSQAQAGRERSRGRGWVVGPLNRDRIVYR
jgi:hypothetical protein